MSSSKEKLEVHAYDITIEDKAINDEGDEHTEIRLWCLDKIYKTMSLSCQRFSYFL